MDDIPLIPRAVIPWFTALRAYSACRLVWHMTPRSNNHTNLNQLPTIDKISDEPVDIPESSFLPGGESGEGEGIAVGHGEVWSPTSLEGKRER